MRLELPAFGAQARLFVLPIPVDADHIELRLACMVRHPIRPLALLLREIIARQFWQEVSEDIPIWASKRYVHPPALAPGDGPVALYRSWAGQFYPDAERRRRRPEEVHARGT